MRTLVMFGVLLILAQGLSARDTIMYLNIQYALNDAAIKLDSSIPVYMGSASLKNEKPFVTPVIVTQKLRNVVPREHRCNEAFAMALENLIKKAKSAGASKVVGIIGFWNSREYDSAEMFQCVFSRNTTAVSLRGDFVK